MPTTRRLLLSLSLAATLGQAAPWPPATPLAPPPAAAQDVDAEVARLLVENEQVAALAAFKDDEAMLRLKLANLARVNASRQEAGVAPLGLDILASRVGNKHCADMAAYRFIGHWSSTGEKPYQRYSFAGGRDHVTENVYATWSDAPFEDTPESIGQMMKEGHGAFMAERPPEDGHRVAVLKAEHTHVGLGVSLKGGYFAYCQEFLDRYVALAPLPARVKPGASLVIKGRMLSKRYGPYALTVYYEPAPKPLADPKEQPGAYGDYTDKTFTSLWPWEVKFNPVNGAFTVPLSLQGARPGSYYCLLYVKEDPATIPYRGEGNADTEGAIAATSIVVMVE